MVQVVEGADLHGEPPVRTRVVVPPGRREPVQAPPDHVGSPRQRHAVPQVLGHVVVDSRRAQAGQIAVVSTDDPGDAHAGDISAALPVGPVNR